MPAISMLLKQTMLLAFAAGTIAENLVISVSTQNGFFQSNPANPSESRDFGAVNPHDYRPNEFVMSDMIFEGLVEWDTENHLGVDGIVDTEDDYVSGALAESWVEGMVNGQYQINFTLRSGVTFHDGTPWNAAAAVTNFEQIIGGRANDSSNWVLRGMHDFLGFTTSLTEFSALDEMTFQLVFLSYYEVALRELCFIRPFRFSSVAALPSLDNFELSHVAFRNGAIREPWPSSCVGDSSRDCYYMRGVSEPLGTGPYQIVHKLITYSNGSSIPLLARDFNATCHPQGVSPVDRCIYENGGYVSEVLLTKHAGHWKNPTYDTITLRAYENQTMVAAALRDGSLDLAYGSSTLFAHDFIQMGVAESASHLTTHSSNRTINVRHLAINSGTLLTLDKRKFVMNALLGANDAVRQALYAGELALETPIDTLFDPLMPHCDVLSTLSSSVDVAASGSGVTAADFTDPIRILYRSYDTHHVIIASVFQAALESAGIAVTLVPANSRDTYNAYNCDYFDDGFSYDGTAKADSGCADNDFACLAQFHAWDISVSQSYGPPYDATTKLWDTTQRWCSAESDAPAVINMQSLDFETYRTDVRGLSNIVDRADRTVAYTNLLSTLHDEAVFLPISAKHHIAVHNNRVDRETFKFGFSEFDVPLANLKPTVYASPSPPPAPPSAPPPPPPSSPPRPPPPSPPPPSPPPPPMPPIEKNDLPGWGIALVTVASLAFVSVAAFVSYMYNRERQGKPIFKPFLAKVEKDGSAP